MRSRAKTRTARPRKAKARKPVNIHEAKTTLSRLIRRVEKGEEVIIARAGKPVAKLVAIEPAKNMTPRPLGLCAGQFTVPEDFDEPDKEILADFEAAINEDDPDDPAPPLSAYR